MTKTKRETAVGHLIHGSKKFLYELAHPILLSFWAELDIESFLTIQTCIALERSSTATPSVAKQFHHLNNPKAWSFAYLRRSGVTERHHSEHSNSCTGSMNPTWIAR
jgi:hypothetical protein